MKMLRSTPKTLTNPFIDFYPHLDVHGETRDSVTLLVKEFIQDNKKLGNKQIVIVHGIGAGILKEEIHNYLKKHQDVREYKLANNNLGITIVHLNIK